MLNIEKSLYKDYFKNTIFPSLIFGGIAGIITGAVIFFFKHLLELLSHISKNIYTFVSDNISLAPFLFLGLILLAILMGIILKYTPNAKGGGIPRSQGILRGLISFKWLKTLIGTFLASCISFFSGLPLGSEGPSVLIGTAIGGGTHEISKSNNAWKRYIMTGSASAGFGVATGAPLAGVIFALEETHKRFSPMILMVAFSSVLFASATSQTLTSVFGGSVVLLDIGIIETIPLKGLWLMPILGTVVGLLSCLFNFLTFIVGKLFDGKLAKIPLTVKLIFAFLLVGVAGLFFTDSVGSGHNLIIKITQSDFALQSILILLAIKIVLVIFSTNSGATGGLFFPLLAIGALIGGAMGKLFVFFGMNEVYYKTIVIIGMCAFLGSTVRAPITALVFVVEATANFNNFLLSGAAVFTAFLVAEVLNVEPLNDVVLNRILKSQDKDKISNIIELEVEIKPCSFVVGKSARDILWPPNSLVRHIVRAGRPSNEERMVKSGDKKMFVGDNMLLQIQTYDKEKSIKEIEDLVGKQDIKSLWS